MKKTHLALAVAVVTAVGASLFNSASADYKFVCDGEPIASMKYVTEGEEVVNEYIKDAKVFRENDVVSLVDVNGDLSLNKQDKAIHYDERAIYPKLF